MTISELIRLANKQEAATNVIEERALKQLDRISKKLLVRLKRKFYGS
jgi:RNase P subunit RPR2